MGFLTRFLIVLDVIILSACAMPGSVPPTQTVDVNGIMTSAAATAFLRLTEFAARATPTSTPVPAAKSTPFPTTVILPTSIPTIAPIQAVMRANANVRSLPFKNKANDIGGLFFNNSIMVIGRNDAATWLYIIYPKSPTGTGWVVANATTIGEKMTILPILIFPNGQDSAPVMLPPFIYKLTGTPLPPGTPPTGWTKFGTIIQPANVRIGPSVGFATIGVLKPGQAVTFQGKLENNTWVQINYPSGPDGRGWILASLVKANDGYSALPLYNILGTPATPQPETTAVSESGTTAVPNLNQTASETPTSTLNTPVGADAEVTTQINVRSGPAQKYQSLGMLNPGDKVVIAGLTLNTFWYRIQFSGNPDGYGWVASQYVRILGDMRQIPYFNNEGTPIPQ